MNALFFLAVVALACATVLALVAAFARNQPGRPSLAWLAMALIAAGVLLSVLDGQL